MAVESSRVSISVEEQKRQQLSRGLPLFLGASRLSDLPEVAGPPASRSIPLGSKPTIALAREAEPLAPPPIGVTGSPPPYTPVKGWTAMTFSDASGFPPDVAIGVGPDHVVEAINTAMAVWDKDGNLVMGPVSLDGFFNTGLAGFDPKVTFDPESGRFFLVLIAVDNAQLRGKLWIAASQTSDPTGMWNKYLLEDRTGSFPDYPGLGFSSDKVIVTANSFLLPFNTFLGAEFWVLRKADLINGTDPLVSTYFPVDPGVFTIQPAESQTPTTVHYMIAVDNATFTTFPFYEVSGEPGVTPITVVRTNLVGNDGSLPPNARQPEMAPDIHSGDDRFLRSTWRTGVFWASGTGACLPPGDTAVRACPRFMSISTTVPGSPTILQDFAYGVAGFDHIWPALQTDALGNLVVVFTRSSTTEFASLRYAGRLVSDPPNTASASVLLKAGERTYDCLCGARNRWGDYFHGVVDPVDGSMWVAGEYMGSPTAQDYATFIANLVLGVPATITTTTSTTSTTTSTTSTTSSTTSTSTSTSSTTTSSTSTTTTSTTSSSSSTTSTTTSTTSSSTSTTSTTTSTTSSSSSTTSTTTSTTSTTSTTTSTTISTSSTTSTTTSTTPPPKGLDWPTHLPDAYPNR